MRINHGWREFHCISKSFQEKNDVFIQFDFLMKFLTTIDMVIMYMGQQKAVEGLDRKTIKIKIKKILHRFYIMFCWMYFLNAFRVNC